MAACRWGNLEKLAVQDFQCQVLNRNLKDAERQNEVSITLSSPANFKENSVTHVVAKGESFLATYGNDSKRSIEERFELIRNNKTNTNLQNVKI